MRRLITICLLALSATALLVSPPVAAGAKKKAPKPSITRVTPMRISVGNVLTIRGRNFKKERRANTIIFRAPNGRTAFAKPRRASRTKLVVVVPEAVSRLLNVAGNRQRPTRLKLRVLAGRFSNYTSRRLSPVVTALGDGDGGPGGGSGGGSAVKVCADDADHDNDLLPNDLELAIGTDACLVDTDLDGVEDGFEYESALALNHYPRTPPLPYPGKRPYPNPLDSGDGLPKPLGTDTDYDGDSITLREESMLWMRYSSDGVLRVGRPTTLSGMIYNDGLQKSIDPAPAAPPPGTLLNWALELYPDGELYDDERDADADGLSNWDESHGRMLETWWPAMFNGDPLPKESKYPERNFLDNEDLPNFDALANSDVDGDGVLDGADDYDGDGLTNQFEVQRPDDYADDTFTAAVPPATGFTPGPNIWAYVNPFNPCKPFRSERCHRDVPFGYYASDELPPVGWDPPAGFPGGGPTTPAG
jgi:IPT/TIG domain